MTAQFQNNFWITVLIRKSSITSVSGQIQDRAELFASVEGGKKNPRGENKLVYRMILFAFTVWIVYMYTLHECLIISDIIQSSDCKNSQY